MIQNNNNNNNKVLFLNCEERRNVLKILIIEFIFSFFKYQKEILQHIESQKTCHTYII